MDGGLFLGNCLDVLPGLPEGCVDFVCADPPYGSTGIEWDRPLYLPSLWRQLRRILSPRGVVLLTAVQPYASELLMSNREWYRCVWYWEKPHAANFASTKRRPLAVVEEALIFAPDGGAYPYHPQRTRLDRPRRRGDSGQSLAAPGASSSKGERVYYEDTPRNLLYATNGSDRGLHPCQKPVTLMAYFVRTYTNPGDVVLDFCMGSGTTGVACVREGRRFIGIEADHGHFDTARRRIVAAGNELTNKEG